MIGGSEHDIWEIDGEVWKVTRPNRFGCGNRRGGCRAAASITLNNQSPAQAAHPRTRRATRCAPQASAGATSRPHAHLYFTTCSKSSAAASRSPPRKSAASSAGPARTIGIPRKPATVIRFRRVSPGQVTRYYTLDHREAGRRRLLPRVALL